MPLPRLVGTSRESHGPEPFRPADPVAAGLAASRLHLRVPAGVEARQRAARQSRRGTVRRGPPRDGGERRLGDARGWTACPISRSRPASTGSIAACEKVLGPSEWSVRLTPALFALGGIFATYGAARRIYGRDAGFWSAVVLGTSLLYLALGRLVLLDTPLSVLMSATLFCFILGGAGGAGRAAPVALLRALCERGARDPDQGPRGLPRHRGRDVPLAPSLRPMEKAAADVPADRDRALPRARGALACPRRPAQPRMGAFLLRLRALGALHGQAGHGRYQPFWFFVPIVLVGPVSLDRVPLGLRQGALAGGWASRGRERRGLVLCHLGGIHLPIFQRLAVEAIRPTSSPSSRRWPC